MAENENFLSNKVKERNEKIQAIVDKNEMNDWLELIVDHKHRSNGNEFKEDIEPRVRNLRVD